MATSNDDVVAQPTRDMQAVHAILLLLSQLWMWLQGCTCAVCAGLSLHYLSGTAGSLKIIVKGRPCCRLYRWCLKQMPHLWGQ